MKRISSVLVLLVMVAVGTTSQETAKQAAPAKQGFEALDEFLKEQRQPPPNWSWQESCKKLIGVRDRLLDDLAKPASVDENELVVSKGFADTCIRRALMETPPYTREHMSVVLDGYTILNIAEVIDHWKKSAVEYDKLVEKYNALVERYNALATLSSQMQLIDKIHENAMQQARMQMLYTQEQLRYWTWRSQSQAVPQQTGPVNCSVTMNTTGNGRFTQGQVNCH